MSGFDHSSSEEDPLRQPPSPQEDFSQATQPDEPLTPGSSRRLAVLAGVGLVVCAMGGAASWWMQANYATGSIPAELPSAVELRYGTAAEMTDQELTLEVQEALKFADDPSVLLAAFDATEASLVAEDPHLEAALNDPDRTPFLGDEPPILQAEITAKFLPEVDLMIDDYVATTKDGPKKVAALREPMRRCLHAALLKQSPAEDDLAVLRSAGDPKTADALVLLCLHLYAAENNESRRELITAAHQARERRVICPSAAVLLSSYLLRFKDTLGLELYASATEAFIEDAADACQQFPDPEKDYVAQNVLFDYVEFGMDRINARGKIDLLLELQARDEPKVAEWLVHWAAFEVLYAGAMHYRGEDLISRVSPADLERFGTLSSQSIEHLLKAWTLAPQQWRLIRHLMDLEARAGSTPRTTDQWFRHLLATRVDCADVFNVYRWTLEQKWGGSAQKQIAFAEKCVESEHLASGLPFRFSEGLQIYFNENAYTVSPGHDLKIRRLISRFVGLLKEYSREQPHPQVKASAAAHVIATLWQAGEFGDLEWFMRVYEDQIDCGLLHRFRIHSDSIGAVAQQMNGPNLGCWLTIHEHLFGDARKLSLTDLDRVDLAIEEAQETIDDENETLATALNSFRRLSATMRKLLMGEELLLSDQDLAQWVNQGLSEDVVYPRSSIEPDDPDEPEQLTFLEQIAPEIGVVEFRPRMTCQECLLTFPLLIDPPVSLSMDIEKLDPFQEPYGVSLLVGPHGSAAFVSDLSGPIVTVYGRPWTVMRDHLPNVTWRRRSSFRWFQIDDDTDYYQERDIRSIKIEAYPDGYKVFSDGKLVDTVNTPLNTAGLIQIGRYSSIDFTGMTEQRVRYRVSNVRLKKLESPSVEISGPL